MNQPLRTSALRVLRAVGLNRIAGKVYYRFIHGFAPAGPELPDAVTRCMAILKRRRATGEATVDYCEFGVFKGFTFLHAQKVAGDLGLDDMRFFGFDSFEGLPELTSDDIGSEGQQPFYEGQYRCSLGAVKEELNKHGVDWSRTFLIKGYFSESLTSAETLGHQIDRIGIALVDCDIYSSTVDVLDFLKERLVDGALVIMDDWKSYGMGTADGQPRAMKEFLKQAPQWRCVELFDYGAYGRVFEFSRK